MGYELKKTQLTFAETISIVQDAVDASFKTDENGVDIEFCPEIKDLSLQCSFYENYIGLKLSDNFDEAFDTYMAVDIDDIEGFNRDQWYSIRNAVNDKIEFRKQKMLQQNIRVTSILDEEIIKLSNVLTEVVQKLPKSFDMKSIQPFVDKINSMKTVDEKKVIEALVKNTSKKNKFLGHLKKQKKTTEA